MIITLSFRTDWKECEKSKKPLRFLNRYSASHFEMTPRHAELVSASHPEDLDFL